MAELAAVAALTLASGCQTGTAGRFVVVIVVVADNKTGRENGYSRRFMSDTDMGVGVKAASG